MNHFLLDRNPRRIFINFMLIALALFSFNGLPRSTYPLSIARLDQEIHFAPGSAQIRDNSILILKDVVVMLKNVPEMQTRI